MTTKFVGMKDFRENLATHTKNAQTKGIRIIVLKKNIPVLEVMPLDEKEITLEKLVSEVKKAREQIKKGKIYSQEELMREFGLL